MQANMSSIAVSLDAISEATERGRCVTDTNIRTGRKAIR
jgi:hypothetical protein